MIDLSEFESISPYTDAEASEALGKLADHPAVGIASQNFFPEESPEFLKNILKQIRTVDQFQEMVMSKFVQWVIDNKAHNFSYEGIENLSPRPSPRPRS